MTGLNADQERALAALDQHAWWTARELGVKAQTLAALYRRGLAERHQLGPHWYAYRLPAVTKEGARHAG